MRCRRKVLLPNPRWGNPQIVSSFRGLRSRTGSNSAARSTALRTTSSDSLLKVLMIRSLCEGRPVWRRELWTIGVVGEPGLPVAAGLQRITAAMTSNAGPRFRRSGCDTHAIAVVAECPDCPLGFDRRDDLKLRDRGTTNRPCTATSSRCHSHIRTRQGDHFMRNG